MSAPTVTPWDCAARPDWRGERPCFCAGCVRRWPGRATVRDLYEPAAATPAAPSVSTEVSTSAGIDFSKRPAFLDALTGSCAPVRAGKRAKFTPARHPEAVWETHAQKRWRFARPYAGEVVVLDMCASWPSALSSVQVAHGALEHTGPEWTGRPGSYLVPVDASWWDAQREGLPCPVGRLEPDVRERWLPLRTVKALRELHAQGRWPAVEILDSWTAEPCSLAEFAKLVQRYRVAAITEHGRDSAAYRLVKETMSKSVERWVGAVVRADEDAPVLDGQDHKWDTAVQRPDWAQAVWAQAAFSTWQLADDLRRMCLAAGVEPPVSLRLTDEVLIPVASWEAVRHLDRPALALAGPKAKKRGPVRVDESGLGLELGRCRVKGLEVYER